MPPSPTFSGLSRDIKVSFLTPSSHCKKAGICRKPRKTKRALQDKKEKGPREKGVGGGIADGASASHPQPLTTDPPPSQDPHSFSFLRSAPPYTLIAICPLPSREESLWSHARVVRISGVGWAGGSALMKWLVFSGYEHRTRLPGSHPSSTPD